MKGRYVYVLNYKPAPYSTICRWPKYTKELNNWGENARWPRPNKSYWKLFRSRDSALEFLFKHLIKGRNVSEWRPRRFYVSLKTFSAIEGRLT